MPFKRPSAAKYGVFNKFQDAKSFSDPSPRNNAAKFHFFPLLPTELRLMIWEAALQSERFVPLSSEDWRRSCNDWLCSGNYWSVGERKRRYFLQSPYNFWRLLLERFRISPMKPCRNHGLLSTCKEARDLALRHFRVALKVDITRRSVETSYFGPGLNGLLGSISNTPDTWTGPTLYLCPEWDVVLMTQPLTGLTNDGRDFESILASFLNMVADIDPLKRGVLKLAVDVKYYRLLGDSDVLKSGVERLQELVMVGVFEDEVYDEMNMKMEPRSRGSMMRMLDGIVCTFTFGTFWL